ncbi:MAG: GNAT family N-acetyltransferase [Bacteroidota bacterium]
MDFNIINCTSIHLTYAQAICDLIADSAKVRGTGIAKRKPEYIRQKMDQGNAVIALKGEELAGFCYIEQWSHGTYIANSGLIVAPAFRKMGLAKAIKHAIFELSQKKYPTAKLFGITTSLAVMKINASLGYQPVTFSELAQDEAFWKGCQSCPNYDILQRNQKRVCLCTAMLAPAKELPAIDLTHQILHQHV